MRVPNMVGALLTAALITGCQTSTTADEEAIREITEAWDAAYNSRDATALAAIYTEDALRMNANEAALQGQEAIRASFVQEFASGTWAADSQGVLQDVHISGKLAAVRGTWTNTSVSSDGERVPDRGDFIGVYLLQDDGSWKCLWDMWTTALPPRPRG